MIISFPALGGHGRAGSLGLLNEDHQTVPSPAPNATILAGNLMISNKVSNGTGGQPATLTLLGNGTSIVHSTPISEFFFNKID